MTALTYKTAKSAYPLLPDHQTFISKSRDAVRQILNNKDNRLLLIVGPCSIHDRESALEYARELKQLSNTVSEQFFIIMRTYVEKARSGLGWKGYLYDPHLDGSYDISHGIHSTRRLLRDIIEIGLPTATEFLDPITAFYYDDLIVWGSIGARTSSSQPHRQMASLLDIPIGIKNCVSGRVSPAVNGCLSASQPQTFLGLSEESTPCIVRSQGNPDMHIVLRGSESHPNYDSASIISSIELLKKSGLPLRLLIDCSHGNSKVQPQDQFTVFRYIIDQVLSGNHYIKGILMESHLLAGKQEAIGNPHDLKYGLSITDACLDWETTKTSILEAAKKLSKI